MIKTKTALLALLLASMTMGTMITRAEANQTREYAVKAAYLFKFMNLIEWPAESKIDKFVIGIVGPGPFGESIGDLDGKLIRGKPLRMVTYPMVSSPTPGEQMILFVDRKNDKKLPSILADLKGRNVLTVGEGPKFAERGGCINLVTVKNRVRFRINVDAVRRASLKISPRLVKVASVLVTDRGKKASLEEYQDILAMNL